MKQLLINEVLEHTRTSLTLHKWTTLNNSQPQWHKDQGIWMEKNAEDTVSISLSNNVPYTAIIPREQKYGYQLI